MLSFTKGAESLSIFLDGVFHSIDKSHINYGVLDAELAKPKDDRRLEMIRSCISIKAMIEVLTFGAVTISQTEVLFEGTKIGGLMAERMLLMLGKGLDIAPYANFMNNVFANPATYTRDELHQWMKKARLPITPDGCFLAFKKVNDNYMDCHSGKCDNTPGNTLAMDRDKCDPSRHNHCSTGFHFASPGYFSSYSGARTLVVKVNPRDVTAIPSDYKFTKGRTCRYEVIAEIPHDKSHDPLWAQDVVDLSTALTPAWVKFARTTGVVIGADGDPSDAEIDQQYKPQFTSGDLVKVDPANGEVPGVYNGFGNFAEVSYVEPNGSVWVRPLGHLVKTMVAPEYLIHAADIGEEKAAVLEAARETEFVNANGYYPNESDGWNPAWVAADKIEDEQTDAGKGTIVSAQMLPGRLNPNIFAALAEAEGEPVFISGETHSVDAVLQPGDKVMLTNMREPRFNGSYVIGEPTPAEIFEASYEAGREAKATEEFVFTTSDGRKFTASEIWDAKEDASIRAAARALGIQDSTLRGWLKKMGQ